MMRMARRVRQGIKIKYIYISNGTYMDRTTSIALNGEGFADIFMGHFFERTITLVW